MSLGITTVGSAGTVVKRPRLTVLVIIWDNKTYIYISITPVSVFPSLKIFDNAYLFLWGETVNLWKCDRHTEVLEDSREINLVEVLNSLWAWAKIFENNQIKRRFGKTLTWNQGGLMTCLITSIKIQLIWKYRKSENVTLCVAHQWPVWIRSKKHMGNTRRFREWLPAWIWMARGPVTADTRSGI